jgi:hypothetical protein
MSKNVFLLCASVTIVGLSGFSFLGGCSQFGKKRAPANANYDASPTAVSSETLGVLENDAKMFGGKVMFPEGLTVNEAIDLWHLSEGSDVFPLRWFKTMNSEFSILSGVTKLDEHLDKKFNVVKETPFFAERSPFPFKWVGVSASWTGAHPTEADVKLKSGESIESIMGVRGLKNGEKSIALVGVNCAFCHSNELILNGKTHFMEGAPNMLNIRGFFQDMYASTAKVMLTPELLEEFLKRNNFKESKYQTARTVAENFSKNLKKELGLDNQFQAAKGKAINFLDSEAYLEKKKSTLRKAMFDNRDVLANYLTRLLKLTYGINEEPSSLLKLRMQFLANSMAINPDQPVTPEGYARTDAFGRIANLVARFKNPIPLTATTSVPPMWNISHRALFHWNANTNSVVMRNMGQSFGLGAILTNKGAHGSEAYDSTTNMHNLHRLESLIYKTQSPVWEDYSKDVKVELVKEGCETFHRTCASCHMPKVERVGPQNALIDYNVFAQNIIRTDDNYNKNQAMPVGDKPFKNALFDFTKEVRNRYYERYQIDPKTQAEWEHRELRGEELFRDTSLGEEGHKGDSSYMNIPAEPAPGYPARHLGGVWATAPYLHNGSVPNLYELLKPAHLRSKIFFVGSREYDSKNLGFRSDFESVPVIPDLEEKAQKVLKGPWAMRKLLRKLLGVTVPDPQNIWEAKLYVACSTYPERCFNVNEVGNSNAGHDGNMFGTMLSEAQKYELIEFMKVLRPEPEYSHNRPPRYSWNGRSCEVYP